MAASKPTSWLSKHSHLLYTIVQIWGPYTTIWTLLLLAMKLRSHCLTPREHLMEFGVCLGWIPRRLTNYSVLYLQQALLSGASPKTISARTSYHPVRLEFLRYAQLIPNGCSRYGFGPPPRFTLDSAWPCIDHRVSGLGCKTKNT